MENKNFGKLIIVLVAQLVVIAVAVITVSKKRHHEYAQMQIRE